MDHFLFIESDFSCQPDDIFQGDRPGGGKPYGPKPAFGDRAGGDRAGGDRAGGDKFGGKPGMDGKPRQKNFYRKDS